MFPRRQQGFTLLEVLLAGFILFLTIATMTMVYRGALLSSSKAEKSLEISAVVIPVRQIVTDEIRKSDYGEVSSGEGTYGEINYRWNASLIKVGQPPQIVQENVTLGDKLEYYFWRVEFSLESGSLYRNYHFYEVSW